MSLTTFILIQQHFSHVPTSCRIGLILSSQWSFEKFWTLQFSRSISSVNLACSSKRMVVHDNMGPGIQLFGARFLNFTKVGDHVTSKFAKCWPRDPDENPLGFISALPEARSLWLWLQVGRNKPRTLSAMTSAPFRGYLPRWRPPPSWIFEMEIWGVGRVKRVKMRHLAKFRGDLSNRCWDMAIFRFRPFGA